MFKSVLNVPCDVCGRIYRSFLLHMVTFEDGLYFVCEDCCKNFVLVDGWRFMTCSEIKRVLDV